MVSLPPELRYGVMVALQILVLSVQVRILVSQPNPPNPLKISGFYFPQNKNGSKTGHENINDFSLYDAITELCKEKKIMLFKPTPFLQYVPAKLHEANDWYVSFQVIDPQTNALKRVRIKFNRIANIRERRKAGREFVSTINEQLALGWNPLLEKVAPRAGIKAFDAMDTFLKAKAKESEGNTMRAYRSYIKILKEWMINNGFNEDAYMTSFTKVIAIRFMEEVDDKVSAQTFNNYLRFYSILCNWMVKKGYIASNPFDDVTRKPKKLLKKKRKTLTDEQLATLWNYLSDANLGYMLICMFCYLCLMRPKEIMLLKCGDVDMKRQMIHVRGEIAKNDNDSDRTIPDDMLALLKNWDLSQPDWYLFSGERFEFVPGPTKVWSQRVSDFWNSHVRPNCGFSDDVQFYSLKDTGITNMLGSGVPASFVKQQADHSSLSMTSVYLGKSAKASEEIKGLDILHKK